VSYLQYQQVCPEESHHFVRLQDHYLCLECFHIAKLAQVAEDIKASPKREESS